VKRADWLGPASSDQAEDNYGTATAEAIANKSRQSAIKEKTNKGERDRLPAKTTSWEENVDNRLKPIVRTWRKAAGKT